MCTFIAMALAPNGDLEKAVAVYKRFGDYLYQIPENGNAKQFEPGTVFFGTIGHCDCGSAIGAIEQGGESEELDLIRNLALVEAAHENRLSEQEWKMFRRRQEILRELSEWRNILCEGLLESKADWTAIYHHFYGEHFRTEEFPINMLRVGSVDEFGDEALVQLPVDTALIITPFHAKQFLDLRSANGG